MKLSSNFTELDNNSLNQINGEGWKAKVAEIALNVAADIIFGDEKAY